MPYINAHGIAQYYELQGQGPTIVFIHGALVDHRLWEPQAAEFRGSHRALRYDLRGHGRTGPSAAPKYSVELFAEDLLALLAALEIELPLLCGISLGGMIAQAYAARYPVAGLVLADTLVSIQLDRRDAVLRRLLYPRWLIMMLLRALDMERASRLLVHIARLTYGEAWLGTQLATREYIRSCVRRMRSPEARKTVDAIYRFRRQPLEAIQAPTLVVTGEHEAGVVYRHSQELLRLVGEARAARMPEAGHLANLDNPAAFNALLREFLPLITA